MLTKCLPGQTIQNPQNLSVIESKSEHKLHADWQAIVWRHECPLIPRRCLELRIKVVRLLAGVWSTGKSSLKELYRLALADHTSTYRGQQSKASVSCREKTNGSGYLNNLSLYYFSDPYVKGHRVRLKISGSIAFDLGDPNVTWSDVYESATHAAQRSGKRSAQATRPET